MSFELAVESNANAFHCDCLYCSELPTDRLTCTFNADHVDCGCVFCTNYFSKQAHTINKVECQCVFCTNYFGIDSQVGINH
jgi:hypothetical protein